MGGKALAGKGFFFHTFIVTDTLGSYVRFSVSIYVHVIESNSRIKANHDTVHVSIIKIKSDSIPCSV